MDDTMQPLFTDEQRQMIRDTYANGASDAEFAVLMEIARARRLNPLLRQIHFVSRWDNEKRRPVWTAQVSIDGLRAIAERTGKYHGQDEPEYIDDANGALRLCKVRVYRNDWTRPAVGIAYWEEYVQTTKDGGPTRMWARMPHVMLAKVAEALALRKAFPEDMSGLYAPEEMAQASRDEEPEQLPQPTAPAPRELPAPQARPEHPALEQVKAALAGLPDDAKLADIARVWTQHSNELAADGSALKAAWSIALEAAALAVPTVTKTERQKLLRAAVESERAEHVMHAKLSEAKHAKHLSNIVTKHGGEWEQQGLDWRAAAQAVADHNGWAFNFVAKESAP